MAERTLPTIIQDQSDELVVSGRTVESPFHQNEDAMLWVPEARMGIVTDASSESENGQLASETVVFYLADHLSKPGISVSETQTDLSKHLIGASDHLHQVARGRPKNKVAAAIVKLVETPRGEVAVFANVGDVRGYLFRNRKLVQATLDHSLLTASEIPNSRKLTISRIVDELDSKQAAKKFAQNEPLIYFYFNNRNWVTQTLGHNGSILPDPEEDFELPIELRGESTVTPHVRSILFREGDLLGLTSDGIHDPLQKSTMTSTLIANIHDNHAQSLIKAAVDEEDNNWKSIRSTFDDKTVLTVKKTLQFIIRL